MGDLNFDATQVAPSTGEFEPVPNGLYPLAITASEKKVNADNPANVGWSLTVQVLDGEHKGKSFRTFLNLQHTNPQAQEIAQKEFSAICHVTGVLKPQNMAELHNIPFQGKVKVTQPRTGKDGKEYGAGNAISQYLTIKGEKIGGGAAPASAAAKPASGHTPPVWAPKKAAA